MPLLPLLPFPVPDPGARWLPRKELVWALLGHVELNHQGDDVTKKREPGDALRAEAMPQ